MKPLLRPILLGIVVVTVVGAYVWHRRSTVKKSRTAVSESTLSAQEQHMDNGPGPNDGPRDGPNQDRRNGNDDRNRGAGHGENDPQGQPGEHGPRSMPVCIKSPMLQKAVAQPTKVSGAITIAKNAVEAQGDGVTALVLTDVPIAEWIKEPGATVYASHFLKQGNFDVTFQDRTFKEAYLCAIRTSDYQEFTYVHVAVCSPKPLSFGQQYTDVTLKMVQLESALELIGFSQLVPQKVWPGTQQRAVSGQINGASEGVALVAVANTPIVDQPDVEANPSALTMTNSEGRFATSFLAKPNDPIYVCALSLPKDTQSIASRQTLNGAGCTKLTPPVRGPGADGLTINNALLTLDPKREYKLTDHEREHYTFLSACLGGQTP